MVVCELVIVHAINDGEVHAFRRGGDQHAFCPRLKVLFATGPIREETSALKRDLYSVGGVRELGWVALGGHVNALSVDDNVVSVGRDVARKLAVNAIVLEQPGV